MQKKQVCIIGCGTYGSYLLKRILHQFGKQVEITVIEIGNETTRSEEEIGIRSHSETSNVARSGRYFGLGGTSARWGGQILFFDEQDNPRKDPLWNEIVQINQRYQETVVTNLLGERFTRLFQKKLPGLKAGIWLNYRKRNLYRHLFKKSLGQVTILKDLRVVRLAANGKKISQVFCVNRKGEEVVVAADVFYLTAGALESCRLLMKLREEYGLLSHSDLGKNFGDHLSVELFRVHHCPPELAGASLLPVLHKGSLITRRRVVYGTDQRVGYLHPIFNKDVQVFSSLKSLLFGKQKARLDVSGLIGGIGFLLRFAFHIFVLKKMYAHQNNWSLQLDIEQSYPNRNYLELVKDKDAYGEECIRIHWKVSEEDRASLAQIKSETEDLLKKNGIRYSCLFQHELSANKIEDIYHPVGFIRVGRDHKAVVDFNNQVNGTENLFHFSTAIFPSARSINPTAAGFCFIEHHLHFLQHLLKEKEEDLSVSLQPLPA